MFNGRRKYRVHAIFEDTQMFIIEKDNNFAEVTNKEILKNKVEKSKNKCYNRARKII